MAKNKVTINDVAKKANVSVTTVSFYLNEKFNKMSSETQIAISNAIRDLGYISRSDRKYKKPAVTLNTIYIILRDITIASSSKFIHGAQDYLQKKGYTPIILQSNLNSDKERLYIQEAMSNNANGIIIQPSAEFEGIWESEKYDMNILFVDSPSKSFHSLWIKCDYYGAIHDTLNLMIERGYQEYIIVTSPPNNIQSRQERIFGLTDNLERQKLAYHLLYANIGISVDELHNKLINLLNTNHPVCIFVCNDWLLSQVFFAISSYKSRIPQMLGLVGFDCTEWTNLTSPSISTLVQPAYNEGYAAAKMLVDKIENINMETSSKILKFTFNENESSLRKNTFLIPKQ